MHKATNQACNWTEWIYKVCSMPTVKSKWICNKNHTEILSKWWIVGKDRRNKWNYCYMLKWWIWSLSDTPYAYEYWTTTNNENILNISINLAYMHRSIIAKRLYLILHDAKGEREKKKAQFRVVIWYFTIMFHFVLNIAHNAVLARQWEWCFSYYLLAFSEA